MAGMDFLKHAAKSKPLAVAPKPKPVSLPAVITAKKAHELSDYAGLIDEVGQLQNKVQDVNSQIQELQSTLGPYGAKLKELTEKLEENVFPDLDPGQPVQLFGNFYRLDAGPQAKLRSISDMDKVKSLLGAKVFMDIAKVQLGDLDKYLTEAQRDECCVTTHGKRKLKIVKAA